MLARAVGKIAEFPRWSLLRIPAAPSPLPPCPMGRNSPHVQSLCTWCRNSPIVVVIFTLTDRASTIPSNIRGCQFGTSSQRGTKVNGAHHRDNPLLRPTGIQIATKSYGTRQAMAPTNNKTVIKPLLLPIESSLDRLGSLSPTRDQRSQQQIGQIRSNQFSSTIPSISRPHIVQKQGKLKYRGPWWWRP